MLSLSDHLAPYEHVIWDWNGTLLQDLDHAVNTVNHLLNKRNLPLLTANSYKEKFHFPIRSYYNLLGFDLNKESFESLCEEFVDLFMRGVFDCPLVPGAREILQTVKKMGKMQSILSASDQTSLDRMIQHFAIGDSLDNVFGIADKFAASKVYRGLELIKLSGIATQKTVLVGDTDHDLEVAQALGVQAILVSHGHQDAEKLRKLHPTVIDVEKF
ncbi:HAD hydrolase-like protein [bacterium]|nr:HAD hydrolase-like protein [bacterium]